MDKQVIADTGNYFAFLSIKFQIRGEDADKEIADRFMTTVAESGKNPNPRCGKRRGIRSQPTGLYSANGTGI